MKTPAELFSTHFVSTISIRGLINKQHYELKYQRQPSSNNQDTI